MAVAILFSIAGLAGMHFGGLKWAFPAGVVAGFIIAQFVPIPGGGCGVNAADETDA